MWQHAGVPPDMCGAVPCLWESVEPTLQLRDSTNAGLELSLTKMADGPHQEWLHQHHLWQSEHWPAEEPNVHTPFWAATLQLRDSTDARLDLSLTKIADCAHQEQPHQHHLWIFEGADIGPPWSRMPTLPFWVVSLMIHPQPKTTSYSEC